MEMTSEKMQPPPRKVKPTVGLKNVHTEQTAKLQNKHQQECDLIDDIRTFSNKRAVLEREYAQGLLKLTSQLLKREFSPPPELSSQDGTGYKTAITVWRCILEETERVARSRLQAAETYQERIFEAIKPLKAAKVQVLKKFNEQLTTIQTEVSQTVREMTKAHKVYAMDESLAHEARTKASEADERLKRKSTGLFQSVASLQRNSAKLTSRSDACEVKVTGSRNEYILAMSASNAHQIRYYSTDLPFLMTMLDGEVYDRVQEFFTLMGRTAVETSGMEQECFSRVLQQSGLVSRQYNLQCFLHDDHLFTDLVQYQFEPSQGDTCNKISREHNAEHYVEKEARKWATKIAKESRSINEYNKTLRAIQSGEFKPESPQEGKDGKDTNNFDPEQKMEELRQLIRKAETAKMKAEARIEALRVAGVNVDEWLTSTQMDSLAIEDDEMTRTPSQVSLRTESSGGHSEDRESTYKNFEEEDDDFMDDTFDVSRDSVGYTADKRYPVQCFALYNFQASNPDELGITADESLELIADGDGDGWVKARNSSGKTGYIPEIYVRFNDVTSPPATGEVWGSDSHGEERWHSSESAPVTSTPYSSSGSNSVNIHDTSSSYSSTDYEVQQTTAREITRENTREIPVNNGQISATANDGMWCRALYDYEATNPEELSFVEGSMIHVTRKDENGIDDGWWEGEQDGKVGVFPSLVVEEMTDMSQDAETPVESVPPTFSPPPPVMVTLPTPDKEDDSTDTLPLADKSEGDTTYPETCQTYNYYNTYQGAGHSLQNSCPAITVTPSYHESYA